MSTLRARPSATVITAIAVGMAVAAAVAYAAIPTTGGNLSAVELALD